MKQIKNLDELNKYISTQAAVLIYFSGQNCSVCKDLKPKIKNTISQNFPKIEIYEVKSDLYKHIASSFSVFSIPTILVFFDSKEFKRYGRNISIYQFIEDLKRPYTLFLG